MDKTYRDYTFGKNVLAQNVSATKHVGETTCQQQNVSTTESIHRQTKRIGTEQFKKKHIGDKMKGMNNPNIELLHIAAPTREWAQRKHI
jgi:hypothetical protein